MALELTPEQRETIAACLRQSLAWGKTYGQFIRKEEWEIMREGQVERHLTTIGEKLFEEHKRETARLTALAEEHERELKFSSANALADEIKRCRRCSTGRVNESHHRLCPANY